jgi:hypothetical protein
VQANSGHGGDEVTWYDLYSADADLAAAVWRKAVAYGFDRTCVDDAYRNEHIAQTRTMLETTKHEQFDGDDIAWIW